MCRYIVNEVHSSHARYRLPRVCALRPCVSKSREMQRRSESMMGRLVDLVSLRESFEIRADNLIFWSLKLEVS